MKWNHFDGISCIQRLSYQQIPSDVFNSILISAKKNGEKILLRDI